MADTATLQLKVDSRQVDQATDELNDLTAAGKRAQSSVTGVGTAAKTAAPRINTASTAANGASKSMGLMRSRVQQVGFQVQDFAVQLQGGTSAFVAFGQQGSQLAGAFGPGGAIIGAFIAIGSIIGGVFAAQMANAGNAVEDLIDKIRDGTEELDKLGEAQKRVFRREQLILIADTAAKVQSYEEKIADAEATLGRFQNATAGMGVSQFLLDREIEKSTKTLDDLNAGRESEVKTLAAQRRLLRDVADGTSEEARAIERRNKAKGRTAFERVAAIGQSPAAQAEGEFEARKAVIDQAEKDRVATEMEISLARQTNARVLQEELTAIEKAGVDQRDALQKTSMNQQAGAASQLAGNLAEIAKAGGKKQFDNYKALASAQAAINAGLAIGNILATPGLGPLAVPLAISVGALAAVQVAQIQAQEYQPRALGGQMKAGGSFLVGERGPELVTMGNRNANIQSAGSFGGEQPAQTVQIINQISPGLESSIQSGILAMLPLINQSTIAAVNKAARQGGSTSRILGAR